MLVVTVKFFFSGSEETLLSEEVGPSTSSRRQNHWQLMRSHPVFRQENQNFATLFFDTWDVLPRHKQPQPRPQKQGVLIYWLKEKDEE